MRKFTPRQWRKLRELSLVKCARALGVCRNTYLKIEKNPSLMTIEQASAFETLVGAAKDEIDFLCQDAPLKV